MSQSLFGGLLLALSTTQAAATPLSADDLVRYALSHHPDPIAAYAAIDVARAERSQVALLSANPLVEAQLSSDAQVGQYIQATLPLSLTGEGWSARRAASLGADAAAAAAHRTDLVLAASARRAWSAAAIADRKAALAEELLVLAGRLSQIAAARTAAGEASTLELNLARVVEAHVVSDTFTLRAEAAIARQALAAYHPDALTAELTEPEDCLPKERREEETPRSDIEAARIATEAARVVLKRERASVLPSVEFGGWVAAQEALSVGPYLSAELPLFTFRQGPVAAARAALSVAEAEEALTASVALSEQQTTRILAEKARGDLVRLEGVDQAARDALISIDRGFEAGEIDLATAVLLRTQVFDGWIASLDARASAVDAELLSMLAREDSSLLGSAP